MRKFIFAFVFGALLIPGSGLTVGLGEIEVNSALNQELDAEIALLSATMADAEQMIVKLASSEEFNRAGIDRPYLLTSLRFKTFNKNGQPYIQVTSPRPIREPFLNFLVEIDWPQGHLIREYTILLDPPVFMGTEPMSAPRPALQESSRPPAATAPAPAASGTSRPAASYAPAAAAPVVSEPASVQGSAVSTTTSVRPVWAPPGGHRVQAGDTAWSLASRLRPDDSVSIEQMMIAMLRTNPEVFINENVNGLKRGYILRVPDRATMAAVDHNDAVALVREQNALWRQYQSQLAGAAPASSIATSSATGTSSDEIDSADESRLNIVSAGSGSGMAGEGKDPTQMSQAELRAQLAAAQEQLETERLEKEALTGKVDRLQGQVDKMKRMLSIEDQEMAEMQAAQESLETAPAADMLADDMPAETVDDELPVEDVPFAVEETMADDAIVDADADTMAADADADDIAGEQAEAEQIFVDETEQQVPAEPVDTVETETAPDYMDTMPSEFVVPEKQSPLDFIMGNPIVMAAIGAGVLLLGALTAFFVRRSRNRKAEAATAGAAAAPLPLEDELEEVADMIEDEALDDVVSDQQVEQSMAEAEAAAAEDDFDAESTMILQDAEDTVLSEPPGAQQDAEEERDDVIAEADVYLAYGIYQQAEELLNNAINEHPERDAYRVKLAETQYASKNADAFVATATALKQQSGTESLAWAKIAAMGKDLCPDNDMFLATPVTEGVDLDELMPKAPAMDIDLEGDAGAEAPAPDLDFSLDEESPLDLPETGDETASLDIGDLDEGSAVTPAEELEFDLSETEAVEETPAEDDFSLDIGADELELDSTVAEQQDDLEEEIDLTADLSDTAILDLSDAETTDLEDATDALADQASTAADDLDLDFGLDEPTQSVADAAGEIDLDMELEDAAEEAIDIGADLDAELGLGDDDDLGDLGDVDEVATKLDLARAYLDMGDAEGTRSILEEVMNEGSDEQKKEAQDILDQL